MFPDWFYVIVRNLHSWIVLKFLTQRTGNPSPSPLKSLSSALRLSLPDRACPSKRALEIVPVECKAGGGHQEPSPIRQPPQHHRGLELNLTDPHTLQWQRQQACQWLRSWATLPLATQKNVSPHSLRGRESHQQGTRRSLGGLLLRNLPPSSAGSYPTQSLCSLLKTQHLTLLSRDVTWVSHRTLWGDGLHRKENCHHRILEASPKFEIWLLILAVGIQTRYLKSEPLKAFIIWK